MPVQAAQAATGEMIATYAILVGVGMLLGLLIWLLRTISAMRQRDRWERPA